MTVDGSNVLSADDMNLSVYNKNSGRQRCLQWTPLISQQLRVRHLYQILAYNISYETTHGFYYTLHSTAMCAPFYTSEIVSNLNPKWSEIDTCNLVNGSCTAFVLRIWCQSTMLLTWGINLSGLVYLGNKLSDIQPESFVENTVILFMHGGYFTGLNQLQNDLQSPLPFIDHLNVVNIEDDKKIYRKMTIGVLPLNIKNTYNIDKLRKLHSLQISIKNTSIEAQILRDKISVKNGTNENDVIEASSSKSEASVSNIRYAPQLLTMTSLNKMLQEKPTKVQKKEIIRIRREIEVARLKTKILLQERDRKQAQLRQLRSKYGNLCDENEDKNSQIMENYRHLSKEMERLREWKREHNQQKEVLQHFSRMLHNRRRQLMSELLLLYPIEMVNENKYTINGVYLPPSDILSDCSDNGLSVALGYVAHILIMCATFLQVPLRYPITHFGFRSTIEDHITPSLSDRSREFPLYTKGKDRMQFNYGVYLLNKNITQYLYLLGAKTPDLKATLPNVLSLLQGKEYRHDALGKMNRLMDVDSTSVCSQDTVKFDLDAMAEAKRPFHTVGSIPDPILDTLRHEIMESNQSPARSAKKYSRSRISETGPGLSQILAIPEAYMNKQISSMKFRSYMNSNIETLSQTNHETGDITSNSDTVKTDNAYMKQPSIEQATEMIPPEPEPNKTTPISIINRTENQLIKAKRLSRSVGSYTDEEKSLELHTSFELGSEPVLNTSSDNDVTTLKNHTVDTLTGAAEVTQQEFLQKWLDSGPALICSEESLYPEEILGTTSSNDSPLTLRTDALLKTKSFNLVKPKF